MFNQRAVRAEAFARLARLPSSSSPIPLQHEGSNRASKPSRRTEEQHLSVLLNGSAHGSRASTNGPGPLESTKTLRQFDILNSICNAAPKVHDESVAGGLLAKLAPYVPQCCAQTFAASPYLRDLQPSPWELLSEKLTDALLLIGLRFPNLRNKVARSLLIYLDQMGVVASSFAGATPGLENGPGNKGDNTLKSISFATSLIGYMKSISRHASFWTPDERLHILSSLESLLSENVLLSTESTFSALRSGDMQSSKTEDLKHLMKRYASQGRPLSGLLLRQGLASFVEACAALLVARPGSFDSGILPALVFDSVDNRDLQHWNLALSRQIADLSEREMLLAGEGVELFRLQSASQQALLHAIKASCLTGYLCCSLVDEEAADTGKLAFWADNTINDKVQAVDETLASAALQCLTILARDSQKVASNLTRTIPRFLMQPSVSSNLATKASECLVTVLKHASQDTVITTLYGLGNSINPKRTGNEKPDADKSEDISTEKGQEGALNGHLAPNSVVSLITSDSERGATNRSALVYPIVIIARGTNDPKIVALAQSMLIQKVGQCDVAVDLKVVGELSRLAPASAVPEFRALLRLYSRLSRNSMAHSNETMLSAIREARSHLSLNIHGESELYEVYLQHLLESIVGEGDPAGEEAHSERNAHDFAIQEIFNLLHPLALLIATNAQDYNVDNFDNLRAVQRDAWYNIAVHGLDLNSSGPRARSSDLVVLARNSPPLIGEELAGKLESDIELNTVLRRHMGASPLSEKRKEMIQLLPSCESDIKDLSYPELTFLKAAYLLETLRASAGDCTKVPIYFVDSHLRNSHLGRCVEAVAYDAIDRLLGKTIKGVYEGFSAPYIATQLSVMFERCCHGVDNVQDVAYRCVDRIISQAPSVLCHRLSIFALLDLLTIMWSSCLEADTDEYGWRSEFSTLTGSMKVQLSDDYGSRRYTLRRLQKSSEAWIMKALNIAPLDVKGILQTYLSDSGVDDTVGHLSLGRSVALKLGSAIPLTDQRLNAIEVEGDLQISTASDFMAQYTTRQEYRFSEPVKSSTEEDFPTAVNSPSAKATPSPTLHKRNAVVEKLRSLEYEGRKQWTLTQSELQYCMRKAASFLCRSDEDNEILSLFVRIPFQSFTKQSIKSGLTFWTGVIKENPRIEPRILVTVIENWIETAHQGYGIFSSRLRNVDPFYLKEEFAPSDQEMIKRQQQRVHDSLVPHFRIFQFLESHYQAIRLGSQCAERAYLRLIKISLNGLKRRYKHPLTRELHFHIILLGITVLRHSVSLDSSSRWRLKDEIISAALAWFASAPMFSFGGNRLQLKAETHLLADVVERLKKVASVTPEEQSQRKFHQSREELLEFLLLNEQTRLLVWLFPLDHGKRFFFASNRRQVDPSEEHIKSMCRIAWCEDPVIAVNLALRVRSPSLQQQLRSLLLQHPDSASDDPTALRLMMGSSLPDDVSSQLKFLLVWAPVDPISAVTFLLPAYRNHPFVIQYAIKALESHSVDVTFFYVPQIVQALRYDALGYIERYIIETAKFSQVFAHQIIWNMKANAYKDEDATDPDPAKPILDKVMESLISSFGSEDREFYEREFEFFGEITGVSGTLRPLLKASKPEKKQKLEEELRKIQVDEGVYLPSNPDGVVVGIDRKSGKPLQSHAKTPYMATFRIRKEQREDESDAMDHGTDGVQTYEIWQSAIFKVGDDCRQDILALQMIAAFRGIFHNVGLPVFVFPYRVTATAPGCGVIDVLPRSISRDMLGREAVNGLFEWFVSQFGGEEAHTFQNARSNFVKSLAAYSIISFLLQFKDRHNGNIMFDADGHVLHIDFGFCFDIAPGGVRFERAPFKLTREMVSVMGGSTETQSFRWFEELCVKAFLASRQHVETLSHLVVCMLDSGLPCFKPETIRHFRERFVLEKSEREAADFVRMLVKKSYANTSTKVYDEFQLLTNGIPY